LGWVRVIWLCLKIVFEIAVAEGHESGIFRHPDKKIGTLGL
jgi:hypothetical protein